MISVAGSGADADKNLGILCRRAKNGSARNGDSRGPNLARSCGGAISCGDIKI